jgi:hypothetical protein
MQLGPTYQQNQPFDTRSRHKTGSISRALFVAHGPRPMASRRLYPVLAGSPPLRVIQVLRPA